ncbi:hypothetical protein AGABI2DRAFT_212194 [Agaricus bisporus var. bisporus H97]|uniref:hypothetical protein n=1 Tax=Agaricus bisporus var. bisporus (strain H97 / ATCC MYA-4626 / FGSC 10389) TaxID=936046 RepID=UPI00029F5AF5|nr:hypothetical protein AGABI2DRAFT_212194 [Agaricus bisporus var. bisporus H97]EKV42627.1 hypothetical protein AGABI2DRAFT_212194 [Agaricus bisporus var. bisporus H97]
MAFLTRLFIKKKDDDFETVLASLASDIHKRQVKLSEMRLREKRSTLLATLYTLLIWLVYTSLWYLNVLPSLFPPTGGHSSMFEKVVRGVPAFIGPIIILFNRRIVQVWYTRKADAEEKTLQNLMRQRRSKVEEIKKKTNFNSMVKLFQEYDEPSTGTTSATPLRRHVLHNQGPTTPQPRPAVGPISQPQTPVTTALQAQLTPVLSPQPMAPPRRRWYDKIADALLGDDDHEVGSPSSRYALICERCFTHNGLIKESMWEDAQFICRNPNCNHLNRSARSKRTDPNTNVPSQYNTPSPRPSDRHSPSASPSSQQHPTSFAPKVTPTDGSDPDAPTVDSIDAGVMEVDA